MPTHNYNITIRKALSRAVILITSLSIILSVAVSTYLDMDAQKSNTIQKLNTLAEIIAFNAATPLLFDDEKTQNRQLKSYKNVDEIQNIHIYRLDEFSGEVRFFASYRGFNNLSIATQINKLSNEPKVIIREEMIEIIYPIIENIGANSPQSSPKINGYVYIRGSLESLEAHFKQRLTIDFLVAIGILVIVLLVTLNLQRRFTRPIEALSSLVRDVSKNKNYALKAPRASITELDQLGYNLNTLFSRTLNQIERQQKNELEIRKLNQDLEAKVNHRTVALKEANQELLNTLERMHQYQNKIVENEKMASLGQMVAGVAHEVNTPIGLGVTGSTLLRDKLEELKLQFENKTLTSKQMEHFIDEGIENLELIYRNLNRAAELVSSFKQVAVSTDSESPKETQLVPLLNNIVDTMANEFLQGAHKINVEGDDSLTIATKITPIQQILEHLLKNSVIHGFKDDQSGLITIKVTDSKDSVTIDYIDNGVGVPNSIKNRIFDPFVTTRRGEGGSGLGMHLVYNLVTQALQGSIVLVDDANKGAHFRIELPRTEAMNNV